VWEAEVRVVLKPGIADPQGATIQSALLDLGWREVTEARVGKLIVLRFDDEGAGREDLLRRVEEMCRRLLANPVLEDYEIGLRRLPDVEGGDA